MAIEWTIEITNVNVQSGRANVHFNRKDTVTLVEEDYNFQNTLLSTNEQRLALLDTVWGKHQEAAQEQSNIDSFITNLEQMAKANLEAREV